MYMLLFKIVIDVFFCHMVFTMCCMWFFSKCSCSLSPLQVIRQQLMQPVGFGSAIKELLEWCSDIRAFQPQYESGLMGCIHAIARFCASPGFDLHLGEKAASHVALSLGFFLATPAQ